MEKKADLPRTSRDVIAAMLFEEIDALCDKVEGLKTTLNETDATIKSSINQLEGAGDRYNQAVIAANRRSKDEMIAYLDTASKIFDASTRESHEELVREIVRKAVSDEVIALKKAINAITRDLQLSVKEQWLGALTKITLTAIISAFATLEIFWLFYRL
jgi:plasmid stability protein